MGAVLLVLALLAGCSGRRQELDRIMALRGKLLSGGCSFDAAVTADYLTRTEAFGMHCQADGEGNLTFTVTRPETIAGITGTVRHGDGRLTFADTALAFELLADGEVSPVGAPWIFLQALRGGYLTSCGMDGELLRAAVDDSYDADALHLDVWFGEGDTPCRADITWKERRILSVEIENFTLE